MARARLLTALMRLPWARVAARVEEAVAAGPDERRGLLDAVAGVPAALGRRRVLPAHVLEDLDLLARADR
jgi:hypothetical protein